MNRRASFDKQMEDHLSAWRKRNIATKEWGVQNRVTREWILPKHAWEEGLWPSIRRGTPWSVEAYLNADPNDRIAKHDGAHNLKSSWILCANLYFPFRFETRDRAMLAGFLQRNVHDNIRSVDDIQLEFAAKGELHPSALLGEASGQRGAKQTSPDIAFICNDGRGLVLTENKFAEHSFYNCSARKKKANNPDRTRCEAPAAIRVDHASQCHQSAPWSRKYWEHLAPIVNAERFDKLRRCPAASGGYQLLRQQALAEGIARSGDYDLVMSCIAIDSRNDRLQRSMSGAGLATLSDWRDVFNGKAGFAMFTHQAWVAWVRSNADQSRWSDWLDYVEQRYGIPG